MQNGEVVQIGTGCPATNDGQHQAEDWCRQCGGVAGVKALKAEAAANAKLAAAATDLLAVCEAELIVLESQLANFEQYEIDATLARAFKVGLRQRINALRDAIDQAKGGQSDE